MEVLPAAELVKVFDFAQGGAVRGIDWIDALRNPRERAFQLPDIRKIPLPFRKQGTIEPEPFEFVKRLPHRDEVLKNYRDHFAFLKDKEISAHNFSRWTEETRSKLDQDVIWISPIQMAA